MDSATVAAALSIMVRLHGDTAPDSELLARAQKRVTAVLSPSGLDTRWKSCWGSATGDFACSSPPAADEVVVRFLAGPPPVSAESCGIALVPQQGHGHFISLFTGCVRAAADRLRIAEDVILGGTLAHEIGHLLLGTNSHGPIGLMQAQPRPIDWERAAHDALRFTAEESAKLRRSLRIRMADRAVDSR